MGLRFRKSIKIMPGVRLNFSKSGVSTSIGGPGATLNFGPKGTRHTVGLPASGISYSHLTPKNVGQEPPKLKGGGADGAIGCGALALMGALIIAVTQCISGSNTNAPVSAPSETPLEEPTGAAAKFSEGDSVQVTSKSLRTRSAPSSSASVSGTLRRGEKATIVGRSGEWLQVAQGSALIWIAANHVRAVRSQPQGFMSASSSHRSHSRKSHGSSGTGFYQDAGCPCAGSRVCIGPRGGRYCITSGGRKRYGI